MELVSEESTGGEARYRCRTALEVEARREPLRDLKRRRIRNEVVTSGSRPSGSGEKHQTNQKSLVLPHSASQAPEHQKSIAYRSRSEQASDAGASWNRGTFITGVADIAQMQAAAGVTMVT